MKETPQNNYQVSSTLAILLLTYQTVETNTQFSSFYNFGILEKMFHVP